MYPEKKKTEKKTKTKDDWAGQMCPLQPTGAEILALDLIGCVTLASISMRRDHLKFSQACESFLVTGFQLIAATSCVLTLILGNCSRIFVQLFSVDLQIFSSRAKRFY